MARHNELGERGEDKAIGYLIQHGYSILDRNWRLGHLELDVVCIRENLLIIVEVKTRTSAQERPGELLSLQKRRHLRRAADAYIKAKGLTLEVRFDLILITGEQLDIEYIQEAVQVFE